jgi:predicted acylesterase/phospholipase RssA
MEQSIILEIIAKFGSAGAFVGYLIWQQMRRDKIDQERIEADKELAGALAALKTIIDSWKR